MFSKQKLLPLNEQKGKQSAIQTSWKTPHAAPSRVSVNLMETGNGRDDGQLIESRHHSFDRLLLPSNHTTDCSGMPALPLAEIQDRKETDKEREYCGVSFFQNHIIYPFFHLRISLRQWINKIDLKRKPTVMNRSDSDARKKRSIN